jgi:hypothetical protein
MTARQRYAAIIPIVEDNATNRETALGLEHPDS